MASSTTRDAPGTPPASRFFNRVLVFALSSRGVSGKTSYGILLLKGMLGFRTNPDASACRSDTPSKTASVDLTDAATPNN
jgi:hypothetical protein